MKIWERLRLKTQISKQERDQLMDELFGIITGRMREFVLKHDAVRAVQTAIKFSNRERRREIAKELTGSYVQLAESRYAKFLIGKLLVQNDEEIRDIVLSEFYGKVRKLINHPEASWILDDTYRAVASKEQKAILLREWYGPEFALRELTKESNPTADLKQILESEPSKRGPIMKCLWEMINTLVQKNMSGFTMLHDAMLQFFSVTQPGTDEFNEMLELVKGDETGDLLKNLAFTRSGSRLVCLLLAHGSAKDRKVLLRNFKDTVVLMSSDRFAHVVLLAAYDVIDDTKLTAKSIFPELLGEGDEATQKVTTTANGFYARTTIMYLLEGLSKTVFPASHSFDVDILKDIHDIRKTTSKKDEETRRMELVAAMSPQLLAAIAAGSSELMSTAPGCQFITEALFHCVGDKQAALAAVAKSAGGDPNQEQDGDEVEATSAHISHNAFAGRMLKSLIQGGKYDKEAGKVIQVDPPLKFSDILYPVIKDFVMSWATGPSSFVVVGLTETPDFEETEALKKTLKKNKKLLEKAASEETADQIAAREAQEQDDTAKEGKKAKRKGERPVGNVGSKILLEKL